MSSKHAPPSPDPVMVLSGKCSVTSLLFLSRDTLVTGHQNGQIQEWSILIQRAIDSWSGHAGSVLWLACVHGKLLSQGRDGLVKSWIKDSDSNHPSTWTVIAQVPSASLIYCNSAIISTKPVIFLVTPSEETSHVNVHEVLPSTPDERTISISDTPVHTLKPSSAKGYGMCMKMCPIDCNVNVTSDGQLLVGYESGSVALWNVSRGEMLHNLELHEDSIMCLTCWTNPTSGQVTGLSASANNVIQCWSISDDKTITNQNSVSVVNEGFNDVAVRKDGRIFATGGWDGRGRVFGIKKLRPLAVLTYHKESINCVAFGPDNELVTASNDGYISFWDVYKNN